MNWLWLYFGLLALAAVVAIVFVVRRHYKVMAEEEKQVKFKVGDRVDGGYGLRGTVTGLGQGEHVVFIKWDYSNSQELTWVSGLTKLNEDEPANEEE